MEAINKLFYYFFAGYVASNIGTGIRLKLLGKPVLFCRCVDDYFYCHIGRFSDFLSLITVNKTVILLIAQRSIIIIVLFYSAYLFFKMICFVGGLMDKRNGNLLKGVVKK